MKAEKTMYKCERCCFKGNVTRGKMYCKNSRKYITDGSVFYTRCDIFEQKEAIEQQARVGRAVQKAFEEGYVVFEEHGTVIASEQTLLEWAE